MNSRPFSMKTLGLLGGLAALALGSVSLGAGTASAEEWTKTYTVSGTAKVHVDTNDGSVRITTGDSKNVEFRVTYQGYSVNKDLNVTSSQNGDAVEVSARIRNGMSWGWRTHRSLRIEVHMPRNADLNVDTGDGSVEAEAIAGNLDIHTGDGHIRVEGAKGQIRLRTGDGSIEAHASHGSKLENGWSVHTGDGSVEMTLPGDLQANIEASTNDGRISLGIPVTVEGTFSTSQIHGKMNGGGQALTIHTGDGSIHLSKT